jgi:hypothetical protein
MYSLQKVITCPELFFVTRERLSPKSQAPSPVETPADVAPREQQTTHGEVNQPELPPDVTLIIFAEYVTGFVKEYFPNDLSNSPKPRSS